MPERLRPDLSAPAPRYSTLRFATVLGPMLAVSEWHQAIGDGGSDTSGTGGALRLHGLYFHDQQGRPESADGVHPGDEAFLNTVACEVQAFLRGTRNEGRLRAIPLAVRGTLWQRLVWEQLRAVARGHTLSYLELARRLGRPQAVRAVAQAVGRNPWIILNPCHRVLGSDGSLTGFAAGLARKRALLDLEAAAP